MTIQAGKRSLWQQLTKDVSDTLATCGARLPPLIPSAQTSWTSANS